MLAISGFCLVFKNAKLVIHTQFSAPFTESALWAREVSQDSQNPAEAARVDLLQGSGCESIETFKNHHKKLKEICFSIC